MEAIRNPFDTFDQQSKALIKRQKKAG